MIEYIKNGDLLLAPPNHYKVIPVNTVGVMGKGLALSAKNKFPEIMDVYQVALKKELTTHHPSLVSANGNNFILFATKQHYRNPSRYVWILRGLENLMEQIAFIDSIKIHMPMIGCGLGGLDLPEVHDVLLDLFSPFESDHDLFIYI